MNFVRPHHRSHWLATLVLVCVVLVLGAVPAGAQTLRDEDGVKIARVERNWPGFAGRGYSELRFLVDNQSERTRDVAVRVGSPSDGDRSAMSALARISMAPRTQRELVVVLPSFAKQPYDWTSVSTGIDGAFEPAPVSIEFAGGQTYDSGFAIAVFSDRALGGAYVGGRAEALRSSGLAQLADDEFAHFLEPAPVWYQTEAAWSGGSVLQASYLERQGARLKSRTLARNYLVDVAPTARLPISVHGYTSLDAVVLDGGPVDPSRLAELARWVRLGGCAVVARDGSFTSFGDLEDARRPGALLCTFQEAEVRRLGLGTVVFTDEGPLQSPGQVHALWWALERAPSWIPSSYSYSDTVLPPRWHFADLRLEGVGGLSHDVMLSFFVAIAVVMAPLNLLLVRRTRRPVALLVTIPLLSLLGSIGVITYGVLRDGLGVVDAVHSWAVLDQESQMVSSAGVRTMFAGMSVGTRLSPGAGTVVLPVDLDGSFAPEGGRYLVERDADTGALKFSGDFLPARRVHSQVVLTDRSSRKRLAASRSGGAVSVENALGAATGELWLRDREGRLWHSGGGIAAGATAVLEPSTDEVGLEKFLVDLGPGPYMSGFERLAPGSYATTLAELIAWEDCGVAAERTSSHQSLVGILEEEALR